jgi:transposase
LRLEHDAYRWLCGGGSVNHHTRSDFRVAHEKELDELMTQVIAALVERGVIKLDRLSRTACGRGRPPARAVFAARRRCDVC